MLWLCAGASFLLTALGGNTEWKDLILSVAGIWLNRAFELILKNPLGNCWHKPAGTWWLLSLRQARKAPRGFWSLSGCCPSHSQTYVWRGKNSLCTCEVTEYTTAPWSSHGAKQLICQCTPEHAEPSCSLRVFGGTAVPIPLGSADGTGGWWEYKALVVVHATVNVSNTNLAWIIFYRNIYGKNFIFFWMFCVINVFFLSSLPGVFHLFEIPNAAVAAVSV